MKKVEETMRAGADIQCMNHLQQEHEIEEARSANNDILSNVESENSACLSTSTNLQNNKFANLTFKKKLKARGRPKRSVRQLCSFNRSQADSQADKVQKPQKRKSNKEYKEEPIVKQRRLQETFTCPVCNNLIRRRDKTVISTECCSQLLHKACFDEVEEVCPDC